LVVNTSEGLDELVERRKQQDHEHRRKDHEDQREQHLDRSLLRTLLSHLLPGKPTLLRQVAHDLADRDAELFPLKHRPDERSYTAGIASKEQIPQRLVR